MRFKKVVPKEQWTDEKTIERIDVTLESVRNLCREMNDIDSRVNVLKERKKNIKIKLSRKWKYIDQLRAQLNNQA